MRKYRRLIRWIIRRYMSFMKRTLPKDQLSVPFNHVTIITSTPFLPLFSYSIWRKQKHLIIISIKTIGSTNRSPQRRNRKRKLCQINKKLHQSQPYLFRSWWTKIENTPDTGNLYQLQKFQQWRLLLRCDQQL
jgi:hypothetical protein